MGGISFIGFLIIGVVAGWLGGRLMRGGGFGFLVNMLVGVVGAYLGGSVLGFLGVSFGDGTLPTLATATVGAVLLLGLTGLLKKAD